MSDAETTSADWEGASYVLSSHYRVEVLEELSQAPATPSTLAGEEEDGPRITHVSRALNELREKGLAKLLVPDGQKKGRVYGITGEGREALGMVSEVVDR